MWETVTVSHTHTYCYSTFMWRRFVLMWKFSFKYKEDIYIVNDVTISWMGLFIRFRASHCACVCLRVYVNVFGNTRVNCFISSIRAWNRVGESVFHSCCCCVAVTLFWMLLLLTAAFLPACGAVACFLCILLVTATLFVVYWLIQFLCVREFSLSLGYVCTLASQTHSMFVFPHQILRL